MEILKNGNPERARKNKQFRCKRCGCIFIAGKSEYNSLDQMEWLESHASYKCKCPTCGKMVYR